MRNLVIASIGVVLGVISFGANAQFNFNRLLDTVKSVNQAAREPSESEEADLGRQYAALLVGAAPLLDNAAVERYVNRVGRWLSMHSERPDLNWQFGVLDSDNVNAFATPGGYILLTKGLLARMKSEAELAGVLAHEIVHVVKKHHLNAMRKGAGLQLGAGALSDYLSQKNRSNSEVNQKLISGFKEIMLRGLDKDDEFEADRMGVVIAARSGYDPYGLPAVLQMLQAMNSQDSALTLMFATHPEPGARIDMLDRAMNTQMDRYASQPQVAERYALTIQSK